MKRNCYLNVKFIWYFLDLDFQQSFTTISYKIAAIFFPITQYQNQNQWLLFPL